MVDLKNTKRFQHGDSLKVLSYMESIQVVKGHLHISETDYSIKISWPYVKYPDSDNYNFHLKAQNSSSSGSSKDEESS